MNTSDGQESLEITNTEQFWTQQLSQVLVGRRIVAIRYTSDQVAEQSDWVSKGVELVLDNGFVVVMEDGQFGAAPGSFTVWEKDECVICAPVLDLQDCQREIGF